MRQAFRRARAFRDEDGVVSVWYVLMAMTILAIGGFAIDHSRVLAEQTRLQVAADAAAHAAAWELVHFDPKGDVPAQLAAARKKGMEYAAANLGAGRPTSILSPDIEIGTWDNTKRTFTATSAKVDAVRVTSYRIDSRSDPLPTTYLGLVGLKSFDLAKASVFQLQLPACAMDGITACNKVQISSGNKFDSGYCVHGNKGVEMNNGNTFDPGVIVSMPKLSMLVGSTASNTGLEEALRQTTYCPAEATAGGINDSIEKLKKCDSDIVKGWCTGVVDDSLKSNRADLNPTMVGGGKFYNVGCKNKQLFLDGGTYTNAIILTDCAVQFRAGVVLENVIVISLSTDKAAFSSPNGGDGIKIGKDDSCKPGGDALLITPGGMQFASGINLSGGQLIAGGNVEFSAQGSGVRGGQITAGGSVVSTSNIHFGPCPNSGAVMGTLYPVMRQ